MRTEEGQTRKRIGRIRERETGKQIEGMRGAGKEGVEEGKKEVESNLT